MVWLVLAGMAACAVLAALLLLLRPSPPVKADPAANEAAFYKAQLEEIRRDAERGLQGEPTGYYPLAAVHDFAAQHPLRVAEGHGLDHFSVMLSEQGARLVADELRWALSTG